MQRVHCDGCKYNEEEVVAKSKDSRIQNVVLSIPVDPRFPGGTDTHTAELCWDCLTLMLSTYFRVRGTELLEIPVFVDRLIVNDVALGA